MFGDKKKSVFENLNLPKPTPKKSVEELKIFNKDDIFGKATEKKKQPRLQ